MGEFVLKDIKMTLDPDSIQSAIEEVVMLNSDLRDAMDALVDYLLNEGVKIAKLKVTTYGLKKSGDLRRSIHVEKADGTQGIGYIVAGRPGDTGYTGDGSYGNISYAVFVEFGFGTGNFYFSSGKRMQNAYAKKNPSAVASSSGRTSRHPAAGKGHYRPAKMYSLMSAKGVEFRGWVYKNRDDGKFYISKGQPPKPFMYNTLLELTNLAERDGWQIVAQYIP